MVTRAPEPSTVVLNLSSGSLNALHERGGWLPSERVRLMPENTVEPEG